jgi:ribosomal protein S18 acetylase RimI-like enzyme
MSDGRIEITPLRREHLDGAIELFAEERWMSYTADTERTWRALAAPGSFSLVALHGSAVIGIAHALSDGEIESFLSVLIVARAHRGRGVGRALLRATQHQAPGLRLDLISDADGFYERLGFERMSGFRRSLRPAGESSPAGDDHR